MRGLQFAIKTLGMKPLKSLLILAPLLGLAACADMPMQSAAGPAPAAPAAHDNGSVYGLFLAGRKAFNDGHGQVAADYYTRAAQSDPSAGLLRERAFMAALYAGDVHRAAGLAPGPQDASLSAQRLGQLTRAVDALAEGRAGAARTALGPEPLGPPHREASLLLTPWLAAADGDSKAALTIPDARGDLLVAEIATLDQAEIYERLHRYDEADAAFRKLTASGDPSEADVIAYGGFLERRGRKADAKALYDAGLKADPSDGLILAARDRIAAQGAAPPQPTIEQGAAQALLAPAASYFAQRQPELGLTYLRLVLRLDPSRSDAWMLLGDTLIAFGNVDAARTAYLHVPATAPQYVSARGRLILTYQGLDEAPRALALAQETVKTLPGNDDALAILANSLRTSERYANWPRCSTP